MRSEDFAKYFRQLAGPARAGAISGSIRFICFKRSQALAGDDRRSVRVGVCAFLFVKTLRRHVCLPSHIPFPKSSQAKLPTVLSPEEVARLIDSARESLMHHTILMTLYATGRASG